MKLKKRGTSFSKVEILNISPFGLWIFVGEREYFLPYKDYPWFQEAKVKDIYNVELQHSDHLYWPDLDVDLKVSILDNPKKYPLVSA